MKAGTLVLMLCIGMMCFTGFGQTTSDLTENSKADIIQVDGSVSVVNAEALSVEQNAVESISLEGSITDNRFDALFKEADAAFNLVYHAELNELLDVGWKSNDIELLIPNLASDPGGVMSLFYN